MKDLNFFHLSLTCKDQGVARVHVEGESMRDLVNVPSVILDAGSYS